MSRSIPLSPKSVIRAFNVEGWKFARFGREILERKKKILKALAPHCRIVSDWILDKKKKDSILLVIALNEKQSL